MAKTMVDAVCDQCSKPFSVAASERNRGRGRCCSRSCSSLIGLAVRRASYKKTELICASCGKAFEAHRSAVKLGKKFCSQACYGQSIRIPQDIKDAARRRICESCGEFYLAPKPSSDQRFCSGKCAFTVVGPKMRAAADTPEARRKLGETLRTIRGHDKTKYLKRDGRHEHRIVAERMIGRPLTADEVAHHINGKSHDNRPENIQVMTRSAHTRMHTLEYHAARRAKETQSQCQQ